MDVAARFNFMGSEGFGPDRVTVTDVNASDKTHVPFLATSRGSIESCSSSLNAKDSVIFADSMNALDSASEDNAVVTELCRHGTQLTGSNNEDVSNLLHCNGSNGLSWIPRSEEVQAQKRGGKLSRSSIGCSKRQRLAQSEDAIGLAGVSGSKDYCDKIIPTKSDSQERTHLGKQRNTSGSKRGDRRNSRVSVKAKYESFSVKSGLASFGSAAGGNNFFGLYGLKTEVNDVTKLVDDLSLNDLLDGTYECTSICKDKGKKAANLTENIVHSVRKACSILQLSRPAPGQSTTELNSNEKMSACLPISVSVVADGGSPTTDLSSSDKDSRKLAETSANLLDFSFDQPKDTLERLALPTPKDLETLLLDASKPAASSKHGPDPRQGKQISRRPSLPAFPWSHAFTGHCRTNSDANKILWGRSTCQGRWARIGNNASSLATASNSFMNLESLTYDETLVPSHGPKLSMVENITTSDSFAPQHLPSGPSSVIPQLSPDKPEDDLKYPGKVEYCPRLFAAAQILCDIATDALRSNPDGTLTWPKKLSQKAMKARKSKSSEKSEVVVVASTSLTGSGHLRSRLDHVMPSKRAKISAIANKKDFGHINGVRKGPVDWSTPKSCRSVSNKPARDLIEETRYATACVVRQSCMMPPPPKVSNRNSSGLPKVRKLMQVDWNRERDGRTE